MFLVTKLTVHETSDLLDQAFRNGQRSIHEITSVECKSWGQVSREAGFLKSVEVGHFFVTRPALVLEEHGITTTCREYSAKRDDTAAEAKGVLGDNTIFGPIHDARRSLQCGRNWIEVASCPARERDSTKCCVDAQRQT